MVTMVTIDMIQNFFTEVQFMKVFNRMKEIPNVRYIPKYLRRYFWNVTGERFFSL